MYSASAELAATAFWREERQLMAAPHDQNTHPAVERRLDALVP